MKFDEALKRSGFAEKYAGSFYERYGSLNPESASLLMRVAPIESCPPALLAHAWMNESSFRFYPPPNTNVKKDPNNLLKPEEWDHGPLQMNMRIYRENVKVKYFKGLPEEDVFGRTFYEAGGTDKSPTPSLFTGNPYYNVLAAARHLARIRGNWQSEGFESLEQMKAGKYTGGDRLWHRARNWSEWEPVLKTLFELLSSS